MSVAQGTNAWQTFFRESQIEPVVLQTFRHDSRVAAAGEASDVEDRDDRRQTYRLKRLFRACRSAP